MKPIAIIGMGCRFPGAVHNPDAFWNLLCNGQDAVVEVPPNRWNIAHFYDPDPSKPGKSQSKWGGFLEHIDMFDASFFGVSPREAAVLDPQQRLLLECTWEALEDAGIVPGSLSGTNTGVFIGVFADEYKLLGRDTLNLQVMDVHGAAGGALSMTANRLSYFLGLHGPSIAVDTACSSSLVAVHLGCQSLWHGESRIAIVGGANIICGPQNTIGISKGGFLSPDGRCKAFDEQANGYVRSEGVGVVVLKPLADALNDGNPIYALIRGSAVNHGGKSQGLTVPDGAAQEALLRAAYTHAEVRPGDIQYVEAHGTGTPVGDPIEAQALARVLSDGRLADQPCLVASVKTNIGHTEGAAGIAGLIKTALCLYHRAIPPHLHFRTPHPQIPLDNLCLRIPQILQPWPDGDGPAIAGVNSFGFGGANAHVVLQEGPGTPSARQEDTNDSAYLVPFSAHSPDALRTMAQAYHVRLTAGEHLACRDIAYTNGVCRSHHPHRLAILARSQHDVIVQLNTFLTNEASPNVILGTFLDRPHRLSFVFTGMGPQWWAMGRHLLEQEPVFREAFEQCDKAFQRCVAWPLLKEFTASQEQSRMQETLVGQTTNFGLQVALTALWHSWGISPDAVVGHSVGEVAAAYVAGIFSLDDAVRISYHRARLQQQAAGRGTMLAVGLSQENAHALLDGYEDVLAIAAINSPYSVTLSGDRTALEEIADVLQQQKVFSRFVQVEVAYHSQQMDELQKPFLEAIATIHPRTSHIPFYSSVAGTLCAGDTLTEHYWWQNVREPVQFASTIMQMAHDGLDTFLQIGPHPALSQSISDCFGSVGQSVQVLASLHGRRDERTTMLTTLGELYGMGFEVTWQGTHPTGGQVLRLPTYPWQRVRYWHESEESENFRLGIQEHPLLGRRLDSPQRRWELALSLEALPYLRDHMVQEAIVVPGAAYVEIGLAVAAHVGYSLVLLEDIQFKTVFHIPQRDVPKLHISFDDYTRRFEVHGRRSPAHEWLLYAQGQIHAHTAAPPHPQPSCEILELRNRLTDEMLVSELYQQLTRRGLTFGSAFRGVERLWRGVHEVLAQIQLADGLTSEHTAYHFHPALLDSCFQCLSALLDDSDNSTTPFIPIRIGQVRFYRSPSASLWCHAALIHKSETHLSANLSIFTDHGELVADLEEVQVQAIARPQDVVSVDIEEWFYHPQWEAKPAELRDSLDHAETWLLFIEQSGLGDALRERLRTAGMRYITVTPGDSYASSDGDLFQIRPAHMDDMQRLLEALRAKGHVCRRIVHLWGLDSSSEITRTMLDEAQLLGVHVVHCLVQALAIHQRTEAVRLWLITRGVQPVKDSAPVRIPQAPLWGFARVLNHEHPELLCTVIDLDSASRDDDVDHLWAELAWSDGEDEIALREAERYVYRWVRAEPYEPPKVPAGAQAYELILARPGDLDALTLHGMTRKAPASGEMEIEIQAAAVNFKDVLKVLNLLPTAVLEDTFFGPSIGMECAGKVVAVGPEVTRFAIGDDVIVPAANHGFATHTTVAAQHAIPKPASMTFEQAAAIPLVFTTAYYSLHWLARLQAGERVLIHAAAGGVGLAAIQIAQWLGAEIFATASTAEKRTFLRSLGIRHVMDSRSLVFADEIMQCTHGEGVDVVLNSIAGAAMQKSLAILRPHGRFVEIGKRDISENHGLSLHPFQKGLSFFAVDIDRLMLNQPAFLLSLWQDVIQKFQEQIFHPLPVTCFPISRASEAFRYIAQSQHIGKVVLTTPDADAHILPLAVPLIHADATYLITGGFGGFGRCIAQWLADQGARYLVLVGRSSAASGEAQTLVTSLQERGVNVCVEQVDVSRASDVDELFARITHAMPPLKGVIHAAGLLDDGLLIHLDHRRFEHVMAPKVWGSWNLHVATQALEIDFFVLFSSISAPIGNPGQAHYAAANEFMDMVAHHRQNQGLPALTINWGVLADVGMMARNSELTARLSQQGVESFTPAQAVQALECLLRRRVTHMGVMRVNWARWSETFPVLRRSPRFAHLIMSEQPGHVPLSLRQALMTVSIEEQRQAVMSFLVKQVTRVMQFTESDLPLHRSVVELGMDSIMAMELSSRITEGLDVTIPVMVFLGGPSVSDLTEYILNKMQEVGDGIVPSTSPIPPETAVVDELTKHLVVQVDQLSEDDVDRLLDQLLPKSEGRA